MQDLQTIFNRIKDTKQKAKQVKQMYKDALENSTAYREVLSKLEELKAKKKEIETSIKEDSGGEFQKLDAYKMSIQADNQLLSDLALNTLMSGETVKVTDNNNEDYEPVFKVSFKKARNIAVDKAVK